MDLSQAVKQLLFRDPFYGHIAIGLIRNFSDIVPTACAAIEGINIALYFNENFWNSINDKQKIGLLQHELGHVCMFHLTYVKDYEDKNLFNIAADITINQYIDSDYLPPKACLPTSFPEVELEPFRDTRYYYDTMKKYLDNLPKCSCQMSAPMNCDDKSSNGNQGGSCDNDKNKDGGDSKSDDQQSDEQNGEQQSNSNCSCKSRLKALKDYMDQGGKASCSHDLWEDANGKPVSDTVRELVKAQISHQIKEVYEEQLNKNPGCIPGHLRDIVKSLYMKSDPVVDWKAVLRQFKSYCDKQIIAFTKNRPNKRFPEFDAVTLRQKRKMLVGLDVSGSICPKTLVEFFTQVGHMARHGVEIDICEWDYGIQRIYEFDPRNPWKSGKVKGGGGTDPTEVVSFLNKSRNHNALIMMTDGYIGGSWVKPTKPILWLITNSGSEQFSFPGKKVKVNIQ